MDIFDEEEDADEQSEEGSDEEEFEGSDIEENEVTRNSKNKISNKVLKIADEASKGDYHLIYNNSGIDTGGIFDISHFRFQIFSKIIP